MNGETLIVTLNSCWKFKFWGIGSGLCEKNPLNLIMTNDLTRVIDKRLGPKKAFLWPRGTQWDFQLTNGTISTWTRR